MTTNPTTSPELKLREEDLEIGRPFVHPETRLEYADFHAYLCGKDPLPHWRNAYIKGIWAGKDDRMRSGTVEYALRTLEDFRTFRVDYITRCYDRDGGPRNVLRTDEHGLAWATA